MNRRVAYMAGALATILTIIALVWGGTSTGAQGREPAGASAATGTRAPRYAVLIDAGSSGSRVHVYTYTVDLTSNHEAWRLLQSFSATAASAARRLLARVAGGGAADTREAGGPRDPAHDGPERVLGSKSAEPSSEHGRGSRHGSRNSADGGGHGSSQGSSSSTDAGSPRNSSSGSGSGSRRGSGSPRGVSQLQRYPDVALPGRVHRISPGLSSLAPAGEGAADYLAPLLDFARQQVPAELHAVTPIRLLATAGLRLLPAEQQLQVLAAAAEVLAGSGFLFVHPGQQQQQQQQQQQPQAVSQPAKTASPPPVDGVRRRLSAASSPEAGRSSSGSGTAKVGPGGSGSGSGSGRVPEEEMRAEAAVAAGSAAWVRVLSGDQEGLYAWAGINFAAGRLQALAAQAAVSPRRRDAAAWLQSEAASTLAVFELGGASMQVTLMPWEPLPAGLGHQLALPGVTRPLYTHSFLGYGLHVAWFRGAMLVAGGDGGDGGEGGGGGGAATDPCLHPGYTSQSSGVTGSGNFSGCVALAEQLLGVGAGQQPVASGRGCEHKRCSIGSEYLPSLLPPFNRSGSSSGVAAGINSSSGGGGGGGSSSSNSGFLIMATEAFHYTISYLRLQPATTLEQLAAAGAAFCARPWSEVEQELVQGRGVEEDHALKLCFGAAYIHTMLSKGFQVSAEEAAHLRFSNWITRPDGSQVEVNWVLGALLAEVVPEQLRRLGHGQQLGASDDDDTTQKSAASARGLLAGGLVAVVLVSGLLCCGVAAAGGEAGVAGGRGGTYRSRRGGGLAPPAAGLSAALASVVVKVVDAGGGGGGGGGASGGAGRGWAGRLGSMWGGAVDAAAYAAANPALSAVAAAAGPGAAVAPAVPLSSPRVPTPGAGALLAALGLGPREGSSSGSTSAAGVRAAQRRGPGALQASGLGAGGPAARVTGDTAHGGVTGGGAAMGEEMGAGALEESIAVASGSTAGVAGSLEQRRGTRAAVAML